MLTFYPALIFVHDILRKAHRHVLKSKGFSKVLTSPPRIVFHNDKSLKNLLVASQLNPESDFPTGDFNCSSKRRKICKIIVPGNKFKIFTIKREYKIDF